MLIYRRKLLIPCDFIVMCYSNASVPWCVVVMHHHHDALSCIITVYNHCDASSLWCINMMHQERYTWLVICDVLLVWCMYDVLRYRVMNVDAWMLMNEWWVLMHECWWMNDECWWWILMDEWWINDAGWRMWNVCWMMYDALMHLWCVMQWCMLNRSMWVKYMCIFCNHNCILYLFHNCFNVLISIFVFVSFRVTIICIMYLQ